jgi:hypothetical protein
MVDFLYCIVDDQGRSYYIDNIGNVVVSSLPVPLNYTPDGWQDKVINYAKSTEYQGMIRTFTIPLNFVRDGAKILRYLRYNYGVQAVGDIVILKRDHDDGKYKGYYKGAIDFSQFTYDDQKATAQVMERGLSELIKANENTAYEIPLNVPEVISVTFDGITLYSVVNVINYKDSILNDIGQPDINIIYSSVIFIGLSVTDTETKYPSLVFNSVTTYLGVESTSAADPNGWLIKAQDRTTINLKGNIKFRMAGSDGYRVLAYIKAGGTSREVDIIPLTPIPGTPQSIDRNFDVNITLDPEELLYIVVANTGSGAGKSTTFDTDNKFVLTYDYRKPATQVQCLRPFYVFSQLISKVTDGKYTASSNLLNNEAFNYVLTCGDALRGFMAGTPVDYKGPVLKTSLHDFFSAYRTAFGIGMANRDVAIIEKRKYFSNDNNIIDLGEIANLQETPALDYIFNTIKIGWPEQTFDDVNGRSEFNTTHTYELPITRVVKELDLTSPYRADCYGAEFTRINLDSKTTTDSESDNAIWMIHINDTLGLNRDGYTDLTGVKTNTVFNVNLTPKMCLKANGDYIRIGLDKLEDKLIKYTTSQKNADLSRVVNGEILKESADYPIAKLAAPLFLPSQIQFDCNVPINIVDVMENDPYGRISFKWKGNTYYGYAFDVGQQPAMDNSQTYKLFATTDSNLKKLI